MRLSRTTPQLWNSHPDPHHSWPRVGAVPPTGPHNRNSPGPSFPWIIPASVFFSAWYPWIKEASPSLDVSSQCGEVAVGRDKKNWTGQQRLDARAPHALLFNKCAVYRRSIYLFIYTRFYLFKLFTQRTDTFGEHLDFHLNLLFCAKHSVDNCAPLGYCELRKLWDLFAFS